MNYSAMKENNVEILLVEEKQAGVMCGKITVFHDICERFKIKPLVQKKSVLLWSVDDIKTAVAQMRLENQLKA